MSRPNDAPLLQTRQLSKHYQAPQGGLIEVFSGLDFEVAAGEMVAIVGQSGCGKSTLLHLLGLLDRPDGGEVWIGGTRTDPLPDAARARFRNANLGFVFQFHHLLKEFSALENVMMPLVVQGRAFSEARPEAARMLEAVGLGARASHRPGELSGGEQQRVAIARALVHRPRVLLADEPTGNLDESTADTIHNLLLDLNRREGITTVVVTHNRYFAARLPRVLQLHLGRLSPAGEDWHARPPAAPGAA